MSVADRLREALVDVGVIPDLVDDRNPSTRGDGNGWPVRVTLSTADADRLTTILNERLHQ